MKHWTVTAEMQRYSIDDRKYVAKRIFLVLRKLDESFSIRGFVALRDGKPLELYSARAVITACTKLHAHGIPFQIHEVDRVDFDVFQQEHLVAAASGAAS